MQEHASSLALENAVALQKYGVGQPVLPRPIPLKRGEAEGIYAATCSRGW